MSTPPDQPFVQRSCALCGVVDGGPRHSILLPSGREAFYHNPGDPDCRVSDANPHPEFTEGARVSQLRHALTHDPNSPTPSPSEWLGMVVTDAQQPGLAGTWTEGYQPGTEPEHVLELADAKPAPAKRKA